jgi:cytochrome c-type biogenesis protein CcmF
LIALGFIGDSYYKQETQGTVSSGESLSIGRYQMRFDQLRFYPGSDGREVTEAVMTLYENGERIRPLNPRRDYFIVQEQPVSIPGVYSTPGKDVYVLLIGWDASGESASFKIYVNSFINWVWIGGLMMILGTIIAAWRDPGQLETSYVIRPELQTSFPLIREG